MPSVHSVSLAIAVLAAGYLVHLCATPPNNPTSVRKNHKIDRIKTFIEIFVGAARLIIPGLVIYQALITLFYPAKDNPDSILPSICAYPAHLYDERFTWNISTAGYILTIALGTAIRLSAYGGLGPNFTFHLTAPDTLVTRGVYAYMQHPSYTGLFLANVGAVGLVARWDAAAGACWMSDSMLRGLEGWGLLEALAYLGIMVLFVWVRVRDEERMLVEQFGEPWQDWHRRTARFVPGIW